MEPSVRLRDPIVPSTGAVISFSIFIASRIRTTSPALTASPAAFNTLRIVPGIGATTEPEPIEEAVETVEVVGQIAAEEPVAEEDKVAAVEAVAEPQVPAKPKKKRAPRRKLIGEEGVVERPLFPFYEQTLF